ncbi:SDR family oxidoreductase [uncultured Arcobacter sp.]|uniref:SDR family oxidoreductase n=1 Tax=uncultured Arcobacter sp. TaxID=165434 RepID=UPI00263812E7|nr:SDR family oxidoreductase [uncultured Arcobacter sp.]
MSYIEKMFNLNNKVVIVTGACGQLGNKICEAFKNSESIVIGIDTNTENNKIDDVEYFINDITKKEDTQKLYESIIKKYERIDILINNAGVSTFENFEERPEESFDWVMDVNLKGTFLGIQTYVNLFDQYKSKQGSIINVGSIFGVVSPDFRNYTDLPRKNSEVYGATKAGVIQMTKYFAVHLAERNIRVNCVSPGGIFNPKNPQGEGFRENYAFRTPMKRMANDEEMIGAILYLASDAASYTTGQNVVIDGGLTAW